MLSLVFTDRALRVDMVGTAPSADAAVQFIKDMLNGGKWFLTELKEVPEEN